MIDPQSVPEVQSDELLARFVLFGGHIRRSSQTLKPDAFMPPPNLELSVTRHLHATEAELWSVGASVAAKRSLPLHGRGDIAAAVCIAQKLVVKAQPIPDNPNHAGVLDWPGDKSAQKIIAQELSASALFVPRK